MQRWLVDHAYSHTQHTHTCKREREGEIRSTTRRPSDTIPCIAFTRAGKELRCYPLWAGTTVTGLPAVQQCRTDSLRLGSNGRTQHYTALSLVTPSILLVLTIGSALSKHGRPCQACQQPSRFASCDINDKDGPPLAHFLRRG